MSRTSYRWTEEAKARQENLAVQAVRKRSVVRLLATLLFYFLKKR